MPVQSLDHGGDGLVIDGRQDQRALALHDVELALKLLELGEQGGASGVVQRRGGLDLSRLGRCVRRLSGRAVGPLDGAGLVAQLAANGQDPVDQRLLLSPASLDLGQMRLLRRQLPGRERFALGGVDADRGFAPDDGQFVLQRRDALAAVVDLRRARRAG